MNTTDSTRRPRLPRLVRSVGFAVLAAAVAAGVASAVGSRAAVAPSPSSAPSIGGSAAAGSTVTANPGTWAGSAPITFQYQWEICGQNGDRCHDLTGATAQTYTIKSSDRGNTLRVRVIASNADGSRTSTSGPSGTIGASGNAPVNTGAPSIDGTTTAGSTLTAENGSWSGVTPITYAYQWEVCGANGNACHDVSGATGQTYQLRSGDTGNTFRVRVTASNSAGSSAATSTASANIGSAPATGCPTLATGAQSVPVANVSLPAQLQITGFTSAPRVIPGTMSSFSVQFHVSDTCGQAVQGADLYATAVPFNQITTGRATTDSAGNTTLQFNRRAGFPVAKHQQLMVLFVRAAKPGENALAGVSARRLISLHVDLKANT